MAKLSKAQQEVMDHAKEAIDFSRTHDFYDWYRRSAVLKVKEMTDEEIDSYLEDRKKRGYVGTKEYEMERYQWNRDGIDFLCHASSLTIRKLEKLGLIEIIEDSKGEYYGLDKIKVLNY